MARTRYVYRVTRTDTKPVKVEKPLPQVAQKVDLSKPTKIAVPTKPTGPSETVK